MAPNVGPKVTTQRGVIWPRDSLLLGGRGRAKRERKRGRCLNTPQWDSAWSDWLGSYGSCWLEVGAEGGFKLDLRQDCDPGRQDCDPGKQKLKGAVRTKTYRHHYFQHQRLDNSESWYGSGLFLWSFQTLFTSVNRYDHFDIIESCKSEWYF
jgi:hypothetical protein